MSPSQRVPGIHALKGEIAMAQDDIQKEIASLRSELEALKANRANEAKTTATAPAGVSPLHNIIDNIDKDEITARLKEAIKRAEQEMKDANPLTVIVVFILGLILGKLLSK